MRKALVCTIAAGLVAILWPVGLTAGLDDIKGQDPYAYENGDVDANGVLNVTDAVKLLQYLFVGGEEPMPLHCEPLTDIHNGDVNGSGIIDLSDPVYLLHFQFLGGPAPVEGCPES